MLRYSYVSDDFIIKSWTVYKRPNGFLAVYLNGRFMPILISTLDEAKKFIEHYK